MFTPNLEAVLDAVRPDEMAQLLERFSQWHRLTGTADCERAADYLVERLQTLGIPHERYTFDGFFSDPVCADLQVDGLGNLPCKPRSASQSRPEGVAAGIVFDDTSLVGPESANQERASLVRFRGKLVLSWNFSEDYTKKLEAAGAAGLIHIWPSDEPVLHEETVNPIWGTPTLDNAGWLPAMPVVGIRRQDGLQLLRALDLGQLRARLSTEVAYRVARVSLPVAFLPGRSKDFILVSGHYDSWHVGITDNAVGNAACLEMARVLHAAGSCLERGVRIAWWPGHSNGRYMGSTWYCDHFWRELKNHCVAHLNLDSPGSLGAVKALPRTTRLEGAGFTDALVARFLGEPPTSHLDISRGADQSFFGVDLPFHLMYEFEAENRTCSGSGGGWWWHTEQDSLDKADLDLLVRDTRLNLATAIALAAPTRLPHDFPGYFARCDALLTELAAHADPAFEFEPIRQAFRDLAKRVEAALTGADDARANAIVKRVGGGCNRLLCSAGTRYDFDNTFPAKPFPGLQKVRGLHRATTPQNTFLFAGTGFVRQANRIIDQLEQLAAWL